MSIAFSVSILVACTGDESKSPPAAPSNLTAEPLLGGAHLTWKDNSDNETQFMILRKEMTGGADFTAIAVIPFNTSVYHDAPLSSGKTYLYRVMAHGDAGSSESNEATVTMP